MSYAHISVSTVVAGTKTLAPQMNSNFGTIVDRVNALSDSINSLDSSGSATSGLLANVAGREQQIADQLGGTTVGTDPNKTLTFNSGSETKLLAGRSFYWYYEFAVDVNYPQPVYKCARARTTIPAQCGFINMGGVPTNSGAVVKLQQKVGGAGAWVDVAGYTWALTNAAATEVLVAITPIPAVTIFSAGTLLRAVVVSGSTGAVLPHDITLCLSMTEAVRNL
jgi:hypothetical protein